MLYQKNQPCFKDYYYKGGRFKETRDKILQKYSLQTFREKNNEQQFKQLCIENLQNSPELLLHRRGKGIKLFIDQNQTSSVVKTPQTERREYSTQLQYQWPIYQRQEDINQIRFHRKLPKQQIFQNLITGEVLDYGKVFQSQQSIFQGHQEEYESNKEAHNFGENLKYNEPFQDEPKKAASDNKSTRQMKLYNEIKAQNLQSQVFCENQTDSQQKIQKSPNLVKTYSVDSSAASSVKNQYQLLQRNSQQSIGLKSNRQNQILQDINQLNKKLIDDQKFIKGETKDKNINPITGEASKYEKNKFTLPKINIKQKDMAVDTDSKYIGYNKTSFQESPNQQQLNILKNSGIDKRNILL